VSLTRRLALATAMLLPLTAVVASPAQAATAPFPAHYAAPYLQLSSSTVGDMAADKASSGVAFYTLAFLIPQSGCTPMWEAGNYALGTFTSQVNTFKSSGGNVIVSFGGAAGGELAQTCTSVSSLTAAYASVVNAYGPRLDFDIEGGPLDDTASISRRDQALAALQAQNPAVQVDFTLPVAPNGLLGNSINLLNDAKAKGVKVNLVNLMTMDFGNGQNALNDAESAANAVHSQLGSIFTGLSSAALWNLIGLTPIAGQNDDNEYFSQTDASTLEKFAAANGVQELSFWEVDYYDKATGYAYSRIFNAITGGSTGGGGGGVTGPTGAITGLAGKCADVAAANSANGTVIDLYTCNGTAAQQWQVASDGTLRSLGKCMDVAAAGTADGTAVDLYDCNGTGAQQWTHSGATLVNPASGKCLDVTGPSTADGTHLQIWTCGGGTNQQWTLPGGTTTAPVISLKAHANAKFVTAGSSALIASATTVGTAQQFDEIDLGSGNIALRAHANNLYVCADNAGASALIANRTTAGGWETFALVHNADGSISLKAAANGNYVTAENAGASALIANRTAIGGWEEFDLAAA
jgi:chitinase